MTKEEVISSLAIKREYAVRLLEEIIKQGHYIQKNINSFQCALDIIEIKYDIWNENNKFILKKMFSVSQLIDEYNNAQSGMYIEDIYSPPHLWELFDRMNDRIQVKLDKIYFLLESLS